MSTGSTPAPPFKEQRLVVLSLCLVWSIIVSGIGLNVLIRSTQAQIEIREKVPSGVTVQFDNLDLYVPGVIITASCAIMALLAAISIPVMIVWPEYATRLLRKQGAIFTLFNGMVAGNTVIYTFAFASNRPRVIAFRDGVKLPPEAVQALITATGVSVKYNKQHAAVLLAIFPWISVLFIRLFIPPDFLSRCNVNLNCSFGFD